MTITPQEEHRKKVIQSREAFRIVARGLRSDDTNNLHFTHMSGGRMVILPKGKKHIFQREALPGLLGVIQHLLDAADDSLEAVFSIPVYENRVTIDAVSYPGTICLSVDQKTWVFEPESRKEDTTDTSIARMVAQITSVLFENLPIDRGAFSAETQYYTIKEKTADATPN
jgi:hypothetical protein